MLFKRSAAALVAASLALSIPSAGIANENDNRNAAAAIAALIGIGAAIAIANSEHQNWENNDHYGEPFSPSPGVVCLPEPRQCYDQGHFSRRWTQRIFG